MDKVIQRKRWTGKKGLYILLAIIVALFVLYQLVSVNSSVNLQIEEENVTFGEVRKEAFQEYITQTGLVIPVRTFYLDAVEGGNIIKIFRESGAMVKKGDPILELENINLRLSVLSQENSLNEQINRVRTTRLQLDQNYLSQKQELALIENQLETVSPQYRRDSILMSKELISQQVYEKTVADYKYNIKRKRFTYESFQNDSTSRLLQLQQLNSSEISMLQSLNGIGKILDNLIIRAPIDGQLSTPELQEGQSINRGDRLGEVDIVGSYKMRVPIDEIYLSRINTGLKASANFAGKDYELVIGYIYPTIREGNFEVDMDFVGDLPEGIKKWTIISVAH